MRPAFVCLVLALAVTAWAAVAGAKPAPLRAAVVAKVLYWPDEPTTPPSVLVTGGYARGRGWLGSAGAARLLKKGAHLTLYHPNSAAPIGEVELLDNGEDTAKTSGSPAWGWEFQARITRAPEDARAWEGEGGVYGVWAAPGGPRPRWVPLRKPLPGNQTYVREIAKWFRAQGFRKATAANVAVSRVLKADVNGDGRDEAFVSARSPLTRDPRGEFRGKNAFGYLVMRYVPRHSREVRTATLVRNPFAQPEVCALCDLDGDGRAEVLSRGRDRDYVVTWLSHWDGRAFQSVPGCGGDA